MRVAIVGSGGTGKTTLCVRLAERLNVQLIPEFAREILSEWGKRLIDLERQPRDMARFQREILSRKLVMESSFDAFIADRATADNAAHWLIRLVKPRSMTQSIGAAESTAYLDRCRAAMVRYEHLILIPTGSLTFSDDGVRDVDQWRQFNYEVTLRGILSVWQREFHVLKAYSLDERVEEVLRVIG